MTIEINATVRYKKEFGGSYTEIMKGYIHNGKINDFNFDERAREFYLHLVSLGIYDEVRINSIEIKSWDLAKFV